MAGWPTGDGDMADRIRALGGSGSPLGPTAGWPQGLRIAARLALDSNLPMFISWGPEMIQLCNDACRDAMGLGDRPCALGGTGRQLWAEAWDAVGPHIERIMGGDLSARREDQIVPMGRRGDGRPAWWALSFSPIDDEGAPGGIGGVLAICRDVTREHSARASAFDDEARQAYLLGLSDALRPLTDAAEMRATAARLLGEALRADRVSFGDIVPGEGIRVEGSEYVRGGVAGAPRHEDAGETVAALEAGVPFAVPDVRGSAALSAATKGACAALGTAAFVAVPLGRDGELFGCLTAASEAPRIWTDQEVGILRETAERTADAVQRAAAEAALRESEERFRQFATASSDALWIRDAATMEIEFLSPAALTIYGVEVEALLGEADPIDALILPVDRPDVAAHMERIRRGESVAQDYRVRRPSDGRLRWIRSTGFPFLDERGRVQRIGGIAEDVTELKATEAALTHSEHRLRTLVEGVPHLVWRAVDGGDWTWSSPQWTGYTGQPEPDSHHLGWLEPVHAEDRERARAAWSRAVSDGRFDVEFRIRNAATGLYRWFQTRATPLRDEAGEIVEWLGTSTDIDDLRRLQEGQAAMVAELQHRTRNLIAVVRSIADDTMDETGPTEAFRAAFADRLSALSRVQGLLSRSEAEPITIASLVRLELDAPGMEAPDRRAAVSGPDVYLRPSTVQTLALALHELATDARKHGALSHERGRLAVTWGERDEGGEHRLALDWVETGLDPAPGRPGAPDRGGGYGRELIERALPHALGARTRYALTAAGVRCTIDIPVRSGPRGEAST